MSISVQEAMAEISSGAFRGGIPGYAVDKAFKALEKQIPKSPIFSFEQIFDNKKRVAYCPICKNVRVDYCDYCYRCGQKLYRRD